MSKDSPPSSVSLWGLGKYSPEASETPPWENKQSKFSLCPLYGALVSLSHQALLFPEWSLLMVKMETKWKHNSSEFSLLEPAMVLSLSFCASLLSHRPFCFQGCASEASRASNSEPISGRCSSLITLGCVRAFISSSCPFKSEHTRELCTQLAFLPHSNSNTIIPNNSNIESILFSYVISHF